MLQSVDFRFLEEKHDANIKEQVIPRLFKLEKTGALLNFVVLYMKKRSWISTIGLNLMRVKQ